MYKISKSKLHVSHFRNASPMELRNYVIEQFPRLVPFLTTSVLPIQFKAADMLWTPVLLERIDYVITDEDLRAQVAEIGVKYTETNDALHSRDCFIHDLNTLLQTWNEKYAILRLAGIEVK
jgi:hypothetical protein